MRVSLPVGRSVAQLEAEGIIVRAGKDLTAADKAHLSELFRREIFPVLTPLAIDPRPPVSALAEQIAEPGDQ